MDLYEPGTGSRLHDFTGGITPAGLVWTVRIPDDAVVTSPAGDLVSVEVQDLPLLDEHGPTDTVPATLSFRLTWTGRGALRRRAGTAPAFAGRFFRRVRARGTFAAGAADGFAFASSTRRAVRSRFALLGTEQNGLFLAAAAQCPGCGGRPNP